MTEDEAKTTICPIMWAPKVTAAPRDIGPGFTGACVTAKCMMWRWETARKGHGYCGMAGRP